MSEIDVQTFDQNALVDLFPTVGNNLAGGGQSAQQKAPMFGQKELDADLFNTPASTTEQTTQPSTSQQTTSTTEQTTKATEPLKDEADILGTGKGADAAAAAASKTGTQLTDLSSYYQDRIKSGKFVEIIQDDEKGNPVPFIPKTAEEYDEILELQINHRIDQVKKDIEKSWYESKSPAWKAVSHYADMVDDPTQLLPFLQGVRTYQSVAGMDENDPEGAEQIIRTRLAQNGDPDEVIDSSIESLKTTDKLLSTAKTYKPIILQQEQATILRMNKEAEDRKKAYEADSLRVRAEVLKTIEKPIFGKTKLNKEEKEAIYDLIGEPIEEINGYGIFLAIDKLFDAKDYDTLREIAFLVAKKDSFYQYLGNNVANQTAASLERKLRVAGESRSTSGNDFDEEQQQRQSVRRDQFRTKPTFGRG